MEEKRGGVARNKLPADLGDAASFFHVPTLIRKRFDDGEERHLWYCRQNPDKSMLVCQASTASFIIIIFVHALTLTQPLNPCPV